MTLIELMGMIETSKPFIVFKDGVPTVRWWSSSQLQTYNAAVEELNSRKLKDKV